MMNNVFIRLVHLPLYAFLLEFFFCLLRTIQTVSYFRLLIVDQFRKDEDDFVGGRRKLREEEEEEGDRDHDPSR